MRRALLPLAAALPLLAGCPIPQPLAEVSKTGTTYTPPRIVIEASAAGVVGTLDGVVPYDPACAGGPQFSVGLTVIDDNPDEVASVRWFVNYDPGGGSTSNPVSHEDLLPPTTQPLNRRLVTPLAFRPVPYGPGPHLLELVVSNGFGSAAAPPVNRAPAAGYEVQVYRWVFVPQAGGRCN